MPIATAAQLGFVAALAVGDACLALAPRPAIAFKWPNDVLLDGRKLAGILLESQASTAGMLDWLVIGIGINLATYPVDIDYKATALSATGADAEPEDVLAALAAALLDWLGRWQDGGGFAAVRAAWLRARPWSRPADPRPLARLDARWRLRGARHGRRVVAR